MNGGLDDLMENVRRGAEARSQALQRLLSAADVIARSSASRSRRVSYTVIPAAEIASGGGFGSGMGFGSLRTAMRWSRESPGQPGAGRLPRATSSLPMLEGGGGGGGGGGGAMGRPVAVIVVGPDGVKVKPVLDMTKLALTAIGAWGAVAALSLRMWRKK